MIKLGGLKELKKQLEQLGAELQQKTMRSAAREAFKPVLEAARAKVPVDEGALQAGIVLATAKTPSGAAAGLLITNNSTGLKQARVAAAAFGEGQIDADPARRWHLTEFGTAHTAAQPFLRPALDENEGRVFSNLTAGLRKRIAKALKGGSR